MSEFYTMPIATAKTNDSYVIPTSHGSLFSSFSAGHNHDEEHDASRAGKKKKSLAHRLKLSKLFGREDKE